MSKNGREDRLTAAFIGDPYLQRQDANKLRIDTSQGIFIL